MKVFAFHVLILKNLTLLKKILEGFAYFENVDGKKLLKDLDERNNEYEVFLETFEHSFFQYEDLKMKREILNILEYLSLFEYTDHIQMIVQDTNKNQNVDQYLNEEKLDLFFDP